MQGNAGMYKQERSDGIAVITISLLCALYSPPSPQVFIKVLLLWVNVFFIELFPSPKEYFSQQVKKWVPFSTDV